MKKILLIGPAPCNIGGISIHLRRLVALLKDEYEFDYVDESRNRNDEYFNFRSLNFFSYLKKMLHADIVHIHSGIYCLRLFHLFVAKMLLKKAIVTIHRDPNVEGRNKTKFTKFLIRAANKVICVNQNGINALAHKGSDKFMLLPAFIPQDTSNEPLLPEEITNFVNKKKEEGYRIMISNAWNLVINHNEDLYGLDMCIEAVSMAKRERKKLALVFLLPTCTLPNLLKQYKDKIFADETSKQILIYEHAASFVRLIDLADIIVRPTNTDGDALTIREALYAKKKTLASDVVERPAGTFLFKNRDVNDFYSRILEALSAPQQTEHQQTIDYKQLYKKIYQ